jgi:uncharacterized surface protein with fasciclin (FAS1) repeats
MNDNKKTMGIVGAVLVAIAIIGGIFWLTNRNDSNETSSTKTEQTAEKQGDIVVVASKTADLSTLVTAVKAANLVETLQGTGPFTVFAPTNSAFAALPAGTLDTLLKPENVEQLKAILTYHVVPGQVLAGDLSDGQEITTVQGGKLTVSITDGKVYIVDAKGNRALVEKADVNTDNGVVHIINDVLLPN